MKIGNTVGLMAMLGMAMMLILPSAAWAQDSLNVSWIGSLYHGMDEVKDVVVSGDGHYAYIAGGFSGFWILDVSDAAHPEVAGSLDFDWTYSVAISGSNAYVLTGDELNVVNIADPANPTLVTTLTGLDWSEKIVISGSYAYLTGWPAILIVDISNPSTPAIAGQYSPGIEGFDLAVQDNRVYVAAEEDGLWIFDVTSPTSPQPSGTLNTAGSALGVAVSGNYAYVGDDNDGLRKIDISNPNAPVEVGSRDTPGSAQGVALSGSFAVVADDAGLRVINTTTMQEVGYEDTMAMCYRVMIVGSRAYVANQPAGMGIVDIATPSAPQLVRAYSHYGCAVGVAPSLSGTYAYVADYSGHLLTANLTDPHQPSEADSFQFPGLLWGVAVSGNHAYASVASWSGDSTSATGVYVFDITDESHPQPQGVCRTGGQWGRMCAYGNYVYRPLGAQGLEIIDVSNPNAPVMAGHYVVPGSATGVTVAGTTAYVTYGAVGLVTLNVTNPASPQLLGFCSNLGITDNVTVAGNYAYVATVDSGLKILNIATPSAPVLVSSYIWYAWGDISRVHAVDIEGNYAFVAAGDVGLRVLDITNPAAPAEVGFYTTDQAVDVTVVGSHVLIADFTKLGIYECPQFLHSLSRVGNTIPTESALDSNYPNPFNPTTQIRYRIAKTGPVGLKVFDATGREVATLVDMHQNPGEYEVQFDGTDLASGTYFAQLKAGDFTQTQKMMLLK